MRRGFEGVALRQFTRLFESGTLSAASDRELLDEFARRRDDAAFEVLMTRYGRLVLNVGRKLLHDPRDVEDAFQATFLVLVRKPPRLRVGESLGPWMSTVAYRVAARARANRIRLNRMETTDGLEAAASADPVADANALALHEELNRLPERLRRPVVCCYLEGLTHERAAERLGCPVGTVRSRLARARLLLHRRLIGRGVAPAVAPLEILFASSNPIEPPLRLIHQTMRLAGSSHAHWPEVGVVSASLLSLVNGVVRMMNLKKVLVALSMALPLGGLVAVGGAQAYQQAVNEQEKIVVGGRTYVAEPDGEGPKTLVKTYYVGDLLGYPVPLDLRPDLMISENPPPKVSLLPLVKLVKETVAPGTWKDDDSAGRDVRANPDLKTGTGGGQERPIGSITPFYLSSSLIVRHTKETHEQVATLLANVRVVVNAAVTRAAKTPMKVSELDLKDRDGLTPGTPLDLQGEDSDAYIRFTAKAPADPATIKGEAKSAEPNDKKPGEVKRTEPNNKKFEATIGSNDGLTTGKELKILKVYRIDSKSTLPDGIPGVKSHTRATARVRRLLQQLQGELDALEKEEESPPTNLEPLKGDFDTPRR